MDTTISIYQNNSNVFILSDQELSFVHLNVIHNQINITEWAPERDPLAVVIPITLIYSLIFFSGLIGNVGTCFVIANNKSMHTATNYYLFSLAISDLLLLVSGLPQEMYSIWFRHPYIFGELFCLLQGFAAETSANATVLTITAFTVERYVAICHPFLSQTLSKLSRAIKFIILIWIVAVFLAIPQALAFGIITYDENHKYCQMTRVVLPYSFEISTFVFFITPMTVITILYVRIGLQLRKSRKIIAKCRSIRMKRITCQSRVSFKRKKKQANVVISTSEGGKEKLTRNCDSLENNCIHSTEASKHVVKMLVAVVVAFFICWAPFHAQRLLAIYGKPNSKEMVTVFTILTYVSGVLYYLSTSINPLLYHILSHKFRIAFKKTFSNCMRKRKVKRKSYSALSGKLSLVNSHISSDSSRPQFSDSENVQIHQSSVETGSRGKTLPNEQTDLKDNVVPENLILQLPPSTTNCNEIYNDDKTNNFKEKEFSLLHENNEKLKEIEIFQSQQFKIKKVDGKIQISIDVVTLPKSITVPQIATSEDKKSNLSNEKSASYLLLPEAINKTA